MPTMLDVAKKAGVALSTVSYTLNGSRPISEETRQRIYNAMEELGYRPHVLARGLASKRSRIIALLFPPTERGLGNTELEFVSNAADAAQEKGYNLVLWSSEVHNPSELTQLTQQGLVDGIVVMEVHMDDARVKFLRDHNIPFSMIGRLQENDDLGYADIDFARTMKTALEYLIGLGHHHIAFINQSRSVYQQGYGPAVRTQTSFDQYVREFGLNASSAFCRPSPQAGAECINDLLCSDPNLTALISMNERAIPGVFQAVTERGWRVPDEFSIVLVVSSPRVAEMTIPPLTTLDSPSAELGRLGVDLLIDQLDENKEAKAQVLVPCQLVERGSTGANRRNAG